MFLQETSGAVMFALLLHDLRNSSSKANPSFKLDHPLQLFMHQSFHGGIWRCAFTVDSVGVPAFISYYLEAYFPVLIAIVGVLVAIVRYVVVGF